MSARERRDRQKLATRQGILTAAREIARQDGWSAVTIRRVADMIEYSPPVIYEYFPSKEEILHELLREGFSQLTATMRQAAISTEEPEERLQHIGEAYWQFSKGNPELYLVMHGMAGVDLNTDVVADAVRDSCELSMGALAIWAESTKTQIGDMPGAVDTLWGLLHGMVSISLANRVQGGSERGLELWQMAQSSLLNAWRTGNGSI